MIELIVGWRVWNRFRYDLMFPIADADHDSGIDVGLGYGLGYGRGRGLNQSFFESAGPRCEASRAKR